MTKLQDQIVTAAYPMFVHRGIRDVSVGDILRASHVTAAQFDQEFDSRDAVAAACLSRREREWTIGVVEAGARSRGTTPEGVLLAILDVFNDWFQRDDYEACTFINVLLEMGKEHPLGQASIGYLVNIRELVATLAVEAQLDNVEEFTLSWHILMKGSIINAVEGDHQAALRAKAMAGDLIARHRTVTSRSTSYIQGPTDFFDFDDFDTYSIEVAPPALAGVTEEGAVRDLPLRGAPEKTTVLDFDMDFDFAC